MYVPLEFLQLSCINIPHSSPSWAFLKNVLFSFDCLNLVSEWTLQYDGSMVYIVFCAEICWRIFGQLTFPIAMQQCWDMCHTFGKGKLLVNKNPRLSINIHFKDALELVTKHIIKSHWIIPMSNLYHTCFFTKELWNLNLKQAHISTNQKEEKTKFPSPAKMIELTRTSRKRFGKKNTG